MVCLLLIGAVLYPLMNRVGSEGEYALIEVDGAEYARVDLSQDTVFTVTTPTGTNTIQVKNHEISVDSADCPDKICVNHAAIHRSGENIVCLPHKLVITIISDNAKESEEPTIDAVAE
ncbi:MAG: NusG domain II-containing protein [Lachnospiraceae bacterium]|nr:NusG domain II-containing protein [Lachnospiraceae bacterium]